MKKIAITLAAACTAAMLCSPVLAAPWGNEPHHIEMDANHKEVGRYMNDPNPEMQKCAREASKHLNDNDWHAAQGYDYHTAWPERKRIMANFRRCAVLATNSGGRDDPVIGVYGQQAHHLEMQRQHNQVGKNIANPEPAYQKCAAEASRVLNNTDAQAAQGGRDRQPAVWAERDTAMRNYETCLQNARKTLAFEARAHELAKGNQDHQIQMARDYAEIEPYTREGSWQRGCASVAKKELDGNEWHANIGYSNWAAWEHRKNIMNSFRSCIEDAKKRDYQAFIDSNGLNCRTENVCSGRGTPYYSCRDQRVCDIYPKGHKYRRD